MHLDEHCDSAGLVPRALKIVDVGGLMEAEEGTNRGKGRTGMRKRMTGTAGTNRCRKDGQARQGRTGAAGGAAQKQKFRQGLSSGSSFRFFAKCQTRQRKFVRIAV